MILKKLYDGSGYIAFSVDHTRPEESLPQLREELKSLNFEGELIFDLLVCNGTITGRFVGVHFDGVDFQSGSVRGLLKLPLEVKHQANDFYLVNMPYLINGVMSQAAVERFIEDSWVNKTIVKSGDSIFHPSYGLGIMKELPTFGGMQVTGIKSQCVKVS